MYSMAIALILVSQQARDEAGSALPHAPVVPHVDKVSVVHRTRAGVASALRRTADVVAPPRPVRPTARRARLRREAG